MSEDVITRWSAYKYDGRERSSFEDEIVLEYPFTVHLDGEEFATMVCTPTHVQDLIVGFLASEGIIQSYGDIESLSIDKTAGFAYIELQNKRNVNKTMVSKRVIGSCCGKSRQFYFLNDAKTAKTIMTRNQISADQCIALMKQLQQSSEDFQKTGGLHNAALSDASSLLVTRSDIGRHNALDKIYGHTLQHSISMKDKIIVFSGRISSEVVLKVSKIGVGILLSKSAPSNLALELAEDLGITTVGFIRDQRMNIYTHPERIVC
ncbi:formate dehydrogenase accessory sulfurtransferase FdhD [Bacillus horti]|uniref:Sulfur carrier protein FdhD n=1 Tax=Caldalkalibacillus horti TaxID=77523 RepID=A0ABT9W335_9BACI|nr:formate dehydrogenase accessory sulfurtransferase FdhD [Bacillus horti]MDQ0167661.1 FdhD protein [Bacillus horti]